MHYIETHSMGRVEIGCRLFQASCEEAWRESSDTMRYKHFSVVVAWGSSWATEPLTESLVKYLEFRAITRMPIYYLV